MELFLCSLSIAGNKQIETTIGAACVAKSQFKVVFSDKRLGKLSG